MNKKHVSKVISALLVIVSLGTAHSAQALDWGSKSFRVCADGNYMPMSNKAFEGYENRVAKLFADKLGLEIEYYWFPQRLGFIRNTLRKEDDNGQSVCDVVMGVPAGYELVKPSKAWFRSTYVLAYVKGRGFDDMHSAEDVVNLPAKRRNAMRIGAHERNPGVKWLANNEMLDTLTPYVAQLGDPNVAPGELEGNDLLAGDTDMAILWGPLAGELQRSNSDHEVVLLPIKSDRGHDLVMDYAIAMGVHFPNGDMAKVLNELIDNSRDEIQAILTQYHVPLVEPIDRPGEIKKDDDDD